MKSAEITPRIGLYSVGLKTYWPQFEGLEQRMKDYGNFIGEKMSQYGTVCNFGLVDDVDSARIAGSWFNQHNVDVVFCHSATYVTSDSVLPVHQICKAPVVVLNLQPTAQIDYANTSTGEWLANCGACPVPELAYAFTRAHIPFEIVNGLLGMAANAPGSVADENTADTPEAKKAWAQIGTYLQAIQVKKALANSRFGFLGGNYTGMLDMYNDFTRYATTFGLQVEICEMCELAEQVDLVTEEEIQAKLGEITDFFAIADGVVADSRVSKPTEAQLRWSATIAAAQQRFVDSKKLDALSYYYHSVAGNVYEDIQSGFIVGHSLLTAKHVPCAGEGDMKTNIAMKICDILGLGGSFCEIVTTDYKEKTILLGHDGPFHMAISDQKPILRSVGVYHGKRGSGISVEAKVKAGPITTLGLTQDADGAFKFIISEGMATDKQIMNIGNTQTQVDFGVHPDDYYDKWFQEAPTHHCAMSVGHNANLFAKVAKLLGVAYVIL